MTPANTSLKRPRHILHLNESEKRQFLDSFDCVFSDIDGVVWKVRSPVPRSAEGFSALEGAGKSLAFITNNGVRKLDQCIESFNRINLKANESQIWNPAKATVFYLRHIKFEGPIYVLGSGLLKGTLRDAGFQVMDTPEELVDDTLEAIVSKTVTTEHVKAVLIDMDMNMTWAKLLQAQSYLCRPECLFLCGATDSYLPLGDGIKWIGPGLFKDILSKGIDREPMTVGKPGKILGEMLLLEYKTKPNRCLMIGDSLAQDIGFGRNCGFQTLLVFTGLNSLKDLQVETENVPDYYADSMADFEQLLNEINGRT